MDLLLEGYILTASWIFERLRSSLYIEHVMDLKRGREVHYILSASWIFERLRSALYIERVMDVREVEKWIIY